MFIHVVDYCYDNNLFFAGQCSLITSYCGARHRTMAGGAWQLATAAATTVMLRSSDCFPASRAADFEILDRLSLPGTASLQVKTTIGRLKRMQKQSAQ